MDPMGQDHTMGGGKTVVGLPPPILFDILEMRGDYEKNTK
jgi:hypothetical protein